MAESRDCCESFGDIESIVHSAGDYVQPSRDLRPRVLEAARLESGERRARRRIGRVAALAALWALFTIHAVERLDTPDVFRQITLVAAGARVFSEPGDGSWALVDAYTELRRRQAEVLRM
jgi:hypothetical protein